MRHSPLIEGHAFRLRPITEADAGFVVGLRGNPALNRWLHAGAVDEAAQRQWLQSYAQRPGDYYFVVESRHGRSPEGLIALYGLDPLTLHAEWGRWVLRPGSLAAVESAWLIYRLAFEVMGIAAVCCRTVADNRAVVSFHDGCGIPQHRVLPAAVELRGHKHDLVEHRVDAALWPAIDRKLGALAQRTARRLQRAAA